MTFRAIISVLMLAVGISGCMTVKVPVQVTRPAEIDMSPYKRIAIGEIKGSMGQHYSDRVKNSLVESGRFEVVDRSQLQSILRERSFSQSDSANPNQQKKSGKLISAAALIQGHTSGEYSEEVTYRESSCSTSGGVRYRCNLYTRRGEVRTDGSIDVIDVQTGKIIKSKPLNATCNQKTSPVEGTPPGIDKGGLLGECLGKNVMILMKAISPWRETVMAAFVKDDAMPDLEKGISYAKAGNMDEAIRIFASTAKVAETSNMTVKPAPDNVAPEATGSSDIFQLLGKMVSTVSAKTFESNASAKPESIANAYWNLGLAYEYSREFDKAVEAFKKANSFNPKPEYTSEIANVQRLKRQHTKLKTQEEAFAGQ